MERKLVIRSLVHYNGRDGNSPARWVVHLHDRYVEGIRDHREIRGIPGLHHQFYHTCEIIVLRPARGVKRQIVSFVYIAVNQPRDRIVYDPVTEFIGPIHVIEEILREIHDLLVQGILRDREYRWYAATFRGFGVLKIRFANIQHTGAGGCYIE